MGEAVSNILESAVNPSNPSDDPSKMSLDFTLSAKSPYSTSSPYNQEG
jgi:hypothetical protein